MMAKDLVAKFYGEIFLSVVHLQAHGIAHDRTQIVN